MSSSNGTSENSEKYRIWELEEQLEDEQHAHRKTNFTLRNVREKLDRLSNGMDSSSPKGNRLEMLAAENEELKKRLEEMERENRDLRSKNSTLKKTKTKETISKKKLSNELAESKSQKEKVDMNGDFKENIQHIVKLNKDSVEILKSERDELKAQSEEQLEKAKNYEMRLKEYEEEVERLEKTKTNAVDAFLLWTCKYKKTIIRLKRLLEKRNEKGDAEEVKKLMEDYNKSSWEDNWWDSYRYLSCDLSKAFRAIQDTRSKPVSNESLYFGLQNRKYLKKDFEELSREVSKGKEGKEWVGKELESEYFEKWEKLIKEASERINKP